MRRWRPSSEIRDEQGSAALEFVTAGVLLLLPLVYLILVVSALQGGSLAVEGASRHAARVFAQSPSATEADAAAVRAIEVGLSDYGIDARTADISVECAPDPLSCFTRGGTITVTVETVVPLPLVPPGLDVTDPSGVPVASSATQPVSRFWGAG